MGRKEVERWDTPNAEQPKLPFPAWGATSKYIRSGDVAGPIFPVSRENDFAKNAPKVEAPKEATQLSYPVAKIEVVGHSYKCDPIPDIKLPPLVIGPVVAPGMNKSGYVAQNPLSPKHSTIINSPIYISTIEGVSASNKHLGTLPPKIDAEPLMSGPMLPVEHGSKYTTQNFGCSGSGLAIVRQKTLNFPGNRDAGDRNSKIIESKNLFLAPQLENGYPPNAKAGAAPMVTAPVYCKPGL